ncbi:YagK/YfjJ domain-containing protein [Enterobacter ludwigii]|nr:inovirus-type Gp2 protein [Enterobacter ludwigii]WNI77507.1 inovirus-type Gp2 protein [Enterobacter ludwigii]
MSISPLFRWPNSVNHYKRLNALTFRLSYMAKHRTKHYSSTERSFGCSQG